MHARIALGLVVLGALQACQVTGPGAGAAKRPTGGEPGKAPASAQEPAASLGPQPALAGKASAPPASPTGPTLGVPARVHVPVPSNLLTGLVGTIIGKEGAALLSNDGLGLIANDGAALLANDGASLIANDGASLIANDGASLIANDGASLIANDGASYRLHRALASSGGPTAINIVDLMLQVTSIAPTPRNLVECCMALYGAQAVYVNRALTTIGKQRLESGKPLGFLMSLPLPGGGQDAMYANVISRSSGGADGHPILWIYDVKHHTEANGGFPTTPVMAVEVTGPGQGRAWWRPRFESDQSGYAFAFSTRFNLPQEEASAELVLRAPGGQLRRASWDFQGPGAQRSLRFRSACALLFQGPGQNERAFRKVALTVDSAGQALAGLRVAPFGSGSWPASSAFGWLAHEDSGLSQAPQFHGVSPQGEHGPSAEGPDPEGEAFRGFSTRLGPLQVQSNLSDRLDEAFDWPAALPDTSQLQAAVSQDIRDDKARAKAEALAEAAASAP